MHRRPSPLLHDYKPSGTQEQKKSKGLQWFAVGLAIPLAGLALISALYSDPPTTPPPVTPAMMAIADSVVGSNAAVPGEPVVELVTFAEPVPEPIADFDLINLKIGRGDTLDKLFRQHNLNLGLLDAIAKL